MSLIPGDNLVEFTLTVLAEIEGQTTSLSWFFRLNDQTLPE